MSSLIKKNNKLFFGIIFIILLILAIPLVEVIMTVISNWGRIFGTYIRSIYEI
jgi:hypothetical protein